MSIHEKLLNRTHLDGSWPFPDVTNARHAGRATWFEVNDALRLEFLNVLPPIYCPAGFMVSEPAAHDERDQPIYTAVLTVNGRHFMRDLSPSEVSVRLETLKALVLTSESAQVQS